MTVTGAPMSPVGGGSPWALCGATDGSAPACTSAGQPGAEQYKLVLSNNTGAFGLPLSTRPQCDVTFSGRSSPNCTAAPGQSTSENLALSGPQSTANGASSYSTTVTWTVVAP
jgi:hypothetical protein